MMFVSNLITLLALVASSTAYINRPEAVFPNWDKDRKNIFLDPPRHSELKRSPSPEPEPYINNPAAVIPNWTPRAVDRRAPSAAVPRSPSNLRPRTSVYGDLNRRELGLGAIPRAFRRQAQCVEETSECGDSPGTCCSNTELCVIINGAEGCCPIGQDCSSGGTLMCEDETQVLCQGLDFCCPPNTSCQVSDIGERTCLGDNGSSSAIPVTSTFPSGSPPTTSAFSTPATVTSINVPAASSSAVPPPPTTTTVDTLPTDNTTSTTPTVTAISTADNTTVVPTSTSNITTTTSSSSSLPTSTSPTTTTTSSNSTYTFTPSPPPAPGTLNTTILATDSQITYTGSWSDGTACSGTSRRTGTTGASLSFQFTGTAIYADTVVGAGSGAFRATVDGQSVTVDPSSESGLTQTESGCAVSWSTWGLRNVQHTVELEFVGPSSTLEFSKFIVTRTGRGASGDPGAAENSNGGDTSDAPSIRNVVGMQGIVVPAIAAFLMAILT